MNNNNEEKGKEDLGLEEDDGHVDKLHAMLMQGDDEPAFPFAGMASSDRSEDVASQRAMIEMLRTMLKGGGGDGASSSGPKADGEHSTTPGPAPCKLKHWYESREVDYVIKVYGHILGFNVVDNPIKVAEAFVVKHSLNPRSTDNTQLVMAIAEKIRQTTAPPAARGRTGQEALADLELNLEEEIKKGAQLNPYADGYEGPTVIRPHGEAGGVTAVYNHQTKQVDVIHYHNEVDAETLKRRDEEDAKRRLAQRERDEAKRRKEHELAEARKLVARNTAEKRTSEAVRPSFAVQPKNPAMASLSRPAKEQLKPKMEWDNAYALARFKKSTPEKFEAELDEAGFTEDEKTLVMLKMQVLTMHEAKKGLAESGEEGGAEKHGRFAGQGHSLVQTKEENGEKGKEEGEFGREGEAASNADDKDDAEVVVDATQPVTQVRIAVPGQPPLVAQFNLTHTVGDIRRHLRRVAPVGRPYALRTLRPPRQLEAHETISEAQLAMSSVTVFFL